MTKRIFILFISMLTLMPVMGQKKLDKWFNKGVEYYNQGDYDKALKWYTKAGEQGHIEAQYTLGKSYFKGEGVTKDNAEAAKWYRKAAEQGHTDAQDWMGYCYYYGEGVPKDYAEAVKWYRKAAEQGQPKSQFNLGYCYMMAKA